MKIGFKLTVIFLAISLIPICIIYIISINSSQKTLKDSIAKNFENLAKEKSNAIAYLMEDRVLETELLTARNEIIDAIRESNLLYTNKVDDEIIKNIKHIDDEWIESKGKTETANKILNNNLSLFLKEYQSKDTKRYGEIFVTDVKGITVAMTKRLSDYHQADEVWWQNSYDNGRGKVFIDVRGYDRSVDALVVGVVVPVKVEETTIGILKINYRIKEILDIVTSTQIGETDFALLVSAQGNILAHSKGDTNRKLTASERRLLNKKQRGMTGGIQEDQEHIMAYSTVRTELFSRVPTPGARRGISGERWEASTWYLLMEIEKNEAFSPLNRLWVSA